MSVLQRKPEIVVFAGPNGSGKSTFTALLKPAMDYINADEIKKNLKCSDLETAELAERQRETHLRNMEEFCFETVMSTDRNINLLKRAKEKSYFIRCYYILTADPMINVFRVKERVKMGGHDVLEVIQNQAVKIILYGSMAKGNSNPESDVDIALIMNGLLTSETEDKLSDFIVDMNLKYDRVFSVIDIDIANFSKWESVSPFYRNMNREGIVLWKAA